MLELDPVTLDNRQVIGQLIPQRDAVPLHFAARQGDNLQDDLADVQPILSGWRFLGKGAYPVDDFAGSIAVLDDASKRPPAGSLPGSAVAL